MCPGNYYWLSGLGPDGKEPKMAAMGSTVKAGYPQYMASVMDFRGGRWSYQEAGPCPACGAEPFVDPYDPHNVGVAFAGGRVLRTVYCQDCGMSLATEEPRCAEERRAAALELARELDDFVWEASPYEYLDENAGAGDVEALAETILDGGPALEGIRRWIQDGIAEGDSWRARYERLGRKLDEFVAEGRAR